MKFSDLQLEASLFSDIEKLGYQDCTPIQTAAMPTILDGKDVAGLAQTGTGKTAAFVIPLMDRLLKSRLNMDNLSEEQRAFLSSRSFADWRAQNFILILVPTRELAEQVYENIVKLGLSSGLRGAAVYGGTGYDKQKEAFKNSVEFVVATPGRLIDLYKEHVVDLKQVRAIVFDEADRMFDMGFKDDMKYILQRVPKERQFLVFSATLNFDVLNTAYQFGAEPVEIDVSRDQPKAENVKDEIFHCGQDEKASFLLSILKRYSPRQAIIFSNFKHNVDRIARFLSDNGVPAMGISSLLTQSQRNRVLELFKAENDRNILVATDVAARGLDIKGVDMVINYELPQDAESYVHRIGRTGRAGAEGHAFSLVGEKDVESLSRIEDYLKHKLDVGWLDDADLVKDFKEFPREIPQGRPFESRGPRQDRGPRSGRGGGERFERAGGGRGPRTGGRPERGARPHRASGSRGDRPAAGQNEVQGEGQQGAPSHRRNERYERGERNEKRSGAPHRGRQPREQGREGSREGREHSRGSHPRHGHSQRPTGHHGRPPRATSAAKPPTAQPSLVQKVKGFFKNLFGE